MATRSLITGGTGFIGKAVAHELASLDAEVVIFDRSFNPVPNTIHRVGTILNQHDLVAASQDVDEIFHLAGVLGTTELLDQAELAIDANVKGTLNALEAARICGVSKFFYPSKPNEWLNMYSISKAAGEEICRLYAKRHSLDVKILRWLNAYGPGQKLYPIRKAVPLFILQALTHLPIEIWGDGTQRVDLIHVNDLAYITVAFTRSDSGGVKTFDTGLCHSVTVRALAELIIQLSGSRSRINFLPMRPGEDPEIQIPLLPTATNELKAERSSIPLQQGLLETIEYYRALPQRDKERALRFYYGASKDGDASVTIAGKELMQRARL